jgi:hypothetical protein
LKSGHGLCGSPYWFVRTSPKQIRSATINSLNPQHGTSLKVCFRLAFATPSLNPHRFGVFNVVRCARRPWPGGFQPGWLINQPHRISAPFSLASSAKRPDIRMTVSAFQYFGICGIAAAIPDDSDDSELPFCLRRATHRGGRSFRDSYRQSLLTNCTNAASLGR